MNTSTPADSVQSNTSTPADSVQSNTSTPADSVQPNTSTPADSVQPTPAAAGVVDAADPAEVQAVAEGGFAVRLDNFEGPFDLLLSLISKHKLDVTEVALSSVTNEFIAHIKVGASANVGKWDLEQTTSFLVVASTLLDLKAARLLPQGDVEDEEDLALLEARDLLFARLLQYRAYKQIASLIQDRVSTEARRHPRAVGLDERYANLLPDVLIGLGLEEFASLAAKALEPKPVFELSLAHLHAPNVSVKDQATLVVDRLRRHGTMTFRALAGDAPDMLTRVARFLALLELFREGAVGFEQMTPLGELSIRWTGAEDGEIEITDEFDGEAVVEERAEATVVEERAEATAVEERAEATVVEERAPASVSKPVSKPDEPLPDSDTATSEDNGDD